MTQETNEEQKNRLEQARRRGWDAATRGDPVWCNPYTKRLAKAWREGWDGGSATTPVVPTSRTRDSKGRWQKMPETRSGKPPETWEF